MNEKTQDTAERQSDFPTSTSGLARAAGPSVVELAVLSAQDSIVAGSTSQALRPSDKKTARFRIRKPPLALVEVVRRQRVSPEVVNLQELPCAREDSNLRPAD